MSRWNEYNSKYIDEKLFVPVTFPYNKPDGILIENLHDWDIIRYINEKNITKVYVQHVCDFNFLRHCTNIEHLSIELRLPESEYSKCPQKDNSIIKEYDLNSLYCLKRLRSLSIGENEVPFVKTKVHIDLSKIPNLQYLACQYSYVTQIDALNNLLVLRCNGYNKKDLFSICSSKDVNTIDLGFSKIESLVGIEQFKRLQCLYLYYNRKLRDISSLTKVKKSLRALRIKNCSGIEDFSALGELENLELLELNGSNILPSLDFLKTMKNLKTFVFNMNVLDGDLTPCLAMSYVFSAKNRKHYNLKDIDLPKGLYVRGNEDIEEWQRLE